MRDRAKIAVIIPALNEQASLGKVLDAVPDWVDDVVVGDNGSMDGTAQVAVEHGARVVSEPRRGYGSACLRAMAALDNPDVVVFLDGDYSDYPQEMASLVDPILADRADLVIGSRVTGEREKGALTLQARFGNWLSCWLIGLFWKTTFTDLGPFRAIGARALLALDMADPDYGWTVEMQVKAARQGMTCIEVPVRYRKRIGRSKVSGTWRGVIGAGVKILGTIFLQLLSPRPPRYLRPPRHEQLHVYTRYPEPGKTKTRLIPALGEKGAARLSRRMTQHALATVERFAEKRTMEVFVLHEGGSDEQMKRWLETRWNLRPQQGDGLGERLIHSFDQAFGEGADSVVTIGTDCPELSTGILVSAFDALVDSDLVIGPARDGGYYLIGLRRPAPKLFQGISWGTADVLGQTFNRVKKLGLRMAVLPSRSDVDRVEDLPVWEKVSAQDAP